MVPRTSVGCPNERPRVGSGLAKPLSACSSQTRCLLEPDNHSLPARARLADSASGQDPGPSPTGSNVQTTSLRGKGGLPPLSLSLPPSLSLAPTPTLSLSLLVASPFSRSLYHPLSLSLGGLPTLEEPRASASSGPVPNSLSLSPSLSLPPSPSLSLSLSLSQDTLKNRPRCCSQ